MRETWDWEFNEQAQYEQILKGEAILTKHIDPEWVKHEEELKKHPNYYEADREHINLSSSESVMGYPSMFAIAHVRALEIEGLIKTTDEDFIFKNELSLGDLSRIEQFFDVGGICDGAAIYLNLEGYSNKEILNSVEALLPKWREQLNIPEPLNVSFAKNADIKKILDYKIIPLIDLMIWCEINDREITHSVYAGTLFPSFNRGDTEFKQTILPFLNKIISDDYRKL